MKKNVFSKALALCLALVLCLGMMAGCGKKQLTAKEHFDLVATKTQKTLDDGAISLYGTTLDSLSSAEGGVTDVKISLGDAGKQLLSTLTGGQIPLDWINEIGLKIGAKVDKSLISDEIGISLNGVDLATIQDTLDADGNKLYLAVPDLFSDVLSLDFGKLAEQAGGSLGVRFDSSALKNVLDFKSWLPSADALKKVYEKYEKLALSNINDVTKEEATVEAGGLTQKCSKLKTTFDSAKMKAISKVLGDELSKDQDVASIADNLGRVLGFKGSEAVDELVDGLVNTDPENAFIDFTEYADDDGNLVGLDVTTKDEDGEEAMKLVISAPEQNGKTALDLKMTAGDQTLTITGSGTKGNNAADGTYSVKLNDAEILTIEAKDNNLEKSAKGLLNGSYTIKFGKAIADLMGSNAVANVLTQFGLKVDVAMTDAKNSTAKIELVDNSGNRVLGADVTQTAGWNGGAGLEKSTSTVDVTDSEALMNVVKGINWTSIMDKLKNAGLPDQLMSALKMVTAMFGGSGE